METPTLFETHKELLDPASISPDHVRGLSLGKLTEQYGTIGLYTRLIDTLETVGLGDNELVQISLQLGLALHANDVRTNGHYTDHLMRVTLRMLEDFNIRDPSLIAAGPLHDAFEDHPRDLILALTGKEITDRETALSIGHQTLASITNEEVADIVWAVTNPVVEAGENKLDRYAEHTTQLVLRMPKPRVLKLADFDDNAVGNHATIGEKQRKLDEKYIRLYRTHKLGLFLPDSLIKGKERTQALHLLSKGHARALGRLASKSAIRD